MEHFDSKINLQKMDSLFAETIFKFHVAFVKTSPVVQRHVPFSGAFIYTAFYTQSASSSLPSRSPSPRPAFICSAPPSHVTATSKEVDEFQCEHY